MESIINEVLGYSGRMVSGSKSGYRKEKPNNFVIFNSNLCTKSKKIWYGDLDLTEDYAKLVFLAKELDQDLYVLLEMDGRFDNESSPRLEWAPVVFRQDGSITIHPEYEHRLLVKEGKLFHKSN
jgi:hypothetical protein